jgi:O-antigen/teichoic acid export membrane protein
MTEISNPAPRTDTVNRRKALTSTLWSALESGGVTMVSFASLIIYSRILSPADFGLFAMILAAVELLGLLSNMPFHDALVQRADIKEEHFDSAFVASLVISAALCAGCWLAGPLFVKSAGDPRAGQVLGLLSIGFLFSGSAATIVARDRREFAFKKLALRSLVGRLGGAAIGIVAAFAHMGVWSLVIQQLMMQALGSLILWITATKRPSPRLHLAEVRELAIFGAAALGGLFTSFAIKRLLIFSAGIFLGTSTAGYVNIAFRTIDTFWAVTVTAIGQVSLPIMARLQNEPERLRAAYRTAVSVACSVLYPAFVGLAVTAPEVIELLFGRKWLPATPYVAMLGFLVLLQAPRLFINPLLTAVGKPGFVLRGYLFGLVYLVCAIAATRLPSPVAVVTVWTGTEFVYVAAFGYFLRRGAGLSLADQFGAVRTPLLATLVMAAAVTVTRFEFSAHLPFALRLAVLAATGIVTYGAVLALIDRRLIGELKKFGRSR